MTPQEQQMIEGLIARIQKTPITDKDADAEQLLQQGLGRNPDALYLLSQTVLVQGYALEQAQRQLAAARSEVDALQHQQPKQNTSFLSSIFGSGGNEAPPRPAASAPPQTQYAPVPGYTTAAGYAAPYAAPYPAAAGGGGGFLRNALQTASGVAAGALAFEGIESLMHGFGHSAGYGGPAGFGGLGGFGGGGAPREEIVNNYYGDAAPGEQHERETGERGDRDSQGADFSSADDRSDKTDDGSRFEDASYGDGSTYEDRGSSGDSESSDASDGGGGFDGGGDDTSV